MTEDPFPSRGTASSKVSLDPSLTAELGRTTPTSSTSGSISSTSAPPSAGVASYPPRAAQDDDDSGGRRSRFRVLGLPWWGLLLAIAAAVVLVFLIADLRNRSRYIIVCNAHRVELHQGRRLPFPFGREPVGGPEYKPIVIPAEADCRRQVFGSEEEAARAFLDMLLTLVRNALANPGASNLKEAHRQLQQALLLTRTYRGQRKEAESMLAELSYREGRAGLARAENELRLALSRFQEAQKLDARRFDDLDDWIAHLEEMLRSIAPTPFSAGTRVGPALRPGVAPSSRPGMPMPQAPASIPWRHPPPPTPTTDAGAPPAGGGVLM